MIPLSKLKDYKWSGHHEIIKKDDNGILNRDEILGFYGRTEKKALEGYIDSVKAGLELDEEFSAGVNVKQQKLEKSLK